MKIRQVMFMGISVLGLAILGEDVCLAQIPPQPAQARTFFDGRFPMLEDCVRRACLARLNLMRRIRISVQWRIS